MEKNRTQTTGLTSIGEMSAVLAHGLRNSLTSLKMILQLLMESSTGQNSDGELLTVALRSVADMEKTVAKIIKYADPRKPDKKICEFNRLVKEAIDLSRYRLNAKNINISLKLARGRQKVEIDDSQFREALINLIFNAHEAMQNGGKLYIRTFSCEQDISRISASESYDSAAEDGEFELFYGDNSIGPRKTPGVGIEIMDTGGGIPKINLERIFEPFFTTKVNGMGLGLAIVKRMIEDHEGTLKVESGSWGSRFVLTVPGSLSEKE